MALYYTYEDAIAGKCEHWQVGTEQVNVNNIEQKNSPKDTVGIYLDVFHKMGGTEELIKFAKANPGKFYDQLLRLLISMEAPKQAIQVEVNIDKLSRQELDQMSSAEIKRLVLSARHQVLDGESSVISDS